MINWELLIDKNAAFTELNVKKTDLLSENDRVLRTKIGIIYIIVNLVNGKVYVGLSKKSFKARYKRGWWITSNNDHLLKAAQKYGHENFRILILEDGRGLNILNILETYYILKFQSYKDEYGYNKTLGGDTNLHSPEVKKNRDKIKKEEIIQKSKKIYGENIFQYINVEISDRSRINLICNQCGYEFSKQVNLHIGKRKQGCPKCSAKQCGKNKTHTFEEFKKLAEQKHRNEYEYFPETYVNLKTKTVIYHKKCGNKFEIFPRNHLIQGCNICRINNPYCSRNVIINNNESRLEFNSIKNAQKFFISNMGDTTKKGLQSQFQLLGNKFLYKGFNIEISEPKKRRVYPNTNAA